MTAQCDSGGAVIPAQAGIQGAPILPSPASGEGDTHLRGDDDS